MHVQWCKLFAVDGDDYYDEEDTWYDDDDDDHDDEDGVIPDRPRRPDDRPSKGQDGQYFTLIVSRRNCLVIVITL